MDYFKRVKMDQYEILRKIKKASYLYATYHAVQCTFGHSSQKAASSESSDQGDIFHTDKLYSQNIPTKHEIKKQPSFTFPKLRFVWVFKIS